MGKLGAASIDVRLFILLILEDNCSVIFKEGKRIMSGKEEKISESNLQTKKPSGRGGARKGVGGAMPGAGRPKGVPNKRTLEFQKKVEDSGLTPVEFLLQIMRDEDEELPVRMSAAEKVAPYVHAKLSSVTMTANIRTHEDMLDELE